MKRLEVMWPARPATARPALTGGLETVPFLVVLVLGFCLSALGAQDPQTAPVEKAQPSPAEDMQPSPGTAMLPEVLYDKTLGSTCWIVVVLADGFGAGTGWVVDRDEKLLLTNHHVVIDAEHAVVDDGALRVFFPQHRDGRLITEREYYIEAVEALRGEIFDCDAKRDLAVIKLESLPDGAVDLPLAPKSASPGETVYSIGNPDLADAMWIFTSGTIRQLHQLAIRAPWGPLEFHAVMTQSPTNSGDSGGPVVNASGQLVGVTESYKVGARLLSNCIDVSEVEAYLDEVRPLLKPQSAVDHFRRGERYFDQKRYDRALSDYTQAIRLDKRFPAAYCSRGWTFLRKGDPDSALGDFDETIRINPEAIGAYSGRADAHLANGDYEKAVAEMTKAIRIDPQRALSYHHRGAIYYEQGDYNRAIADCSEAIRLDPEDADYYNNRGRAHDAKGQYGLAIADYDRAIRLNPEKAVFYANRGHAYRKRGDYQQADANFARMEQVDPEYARKKRCLYDRKYLKIANASGEPIRVYLVYHTIKAGGNWEWFPAAPGSDRYVWYRFAPGEASYVRHDDFKINADRVRIWAESGNGEGGWTAFKDRDLELVDGEGYHGYYMRTYTFEFTP